MKMKFSVVICLCFSILLPDPSTAKESNERLQELKTKLENLQNVLSSLNTEIQEYVAVPVVEETKRVVVRDYLPAPQVEPPQQDNALKKFEKNLSPQDIAILKKAQSKVKYLQAVLQEAPSPNNPGDSEDVHPVPAMAKTVSQRELNDALSELSPEDRQLLQKHQSKLGLVIKALEASGHSDPRDVDTPQEEVDMSKKSEPVAVPQPANDDKLLLDVKMKLAELKEMLSIHGTGGASVWEDSRQQAYDEPDKSAHDPDQSTQDKGSLSQIIGEGTFGDFPSQREQRSFNEVWHDGPLLAEQLGAMELLRCADCDCEGCLCVEDRCHHQPPDADAQNVAKKFLNDLSDAKAKGVDLRQILGALTHIKSRIKKVNSGTKAQEALRQLRVRKSADDQS